MKLYALILTALLGTAALAQQSPKPEQAPVVPAQKLPRATPPKELKPNADGSTTLSAGPLEEVVAEIEQRVPNWLPKSPDGDWVMPNILYAQDARDAKVPGALTLRGVSPLQALTLAAAAADCGLDPVFASKEPGASENGPLSIIGYRIVRAAETASVPGYSLGWSVKPTQVSPTTMKPSDTGRVPLGTSAANGIEVVKSRRATYDARTGESWSSDDAHHPVAAQKTVPPFDPAQNKPETADPFSNQPLPAVDSNRSFVRVYALGSILNGNKDEVATKEKYFQDLISAALEKAAPESGGIGPIGSSGTGTGSSSIGNKAMPELSFHLELRALIVKGTAAQHEIIEQVMKALKENETQPAVPFGR